jgi:hypothetical protein
MNKKEANRKRCCLPPEEAFWNNVISTYKAAAKDRSYIWDLSNELAISIMKEPCHYCGVEPKADYRLFKRKRFGIITPDEEYNKQYIFNRNGLDRVDNSKGYTLDNAVSCCNMCNRAKLDSTYNEFMDWLQRIAKSIGKG